MFTKNPLRGWKITNSCQVTWNSLYFMNLKYKLWGGVIRWALNLSPSHSPGCFNLIFNFKCSQSSVDGMHDLISLVTTSSAIEASYYNVFCACKISSPVECEGSICFLTTGACIPVEKQFFSLCDFPELNKEYLHVHSLWTSCVHLFWSWAWSHTRHRGIHSRYSKTWQHDYNGRVLPSKMAKISFLKIVIKWTSLANIFRVIYNLKLKDINSLIVGIGELCYEKIIKMATNAALEILFHISL